MGETSAPAAAARAFLPKTAVYVDGQWVPEPSGDVHVHVNPADGQPLGEWRLAGAAEVDHAVLAAQRAQRAWHALAPARRRAALSALATALRERADDLAALVTLEMGIPLRASVAGVQAAAEWFDHYAGYADKIEGFVPSMGGGVLDYAQYEPYGVVAAIIPWNGPVVALALKVAPALAAGNGVVLKPSEAAPFSSLRFAELAVESGIPAGLVNVVPGGPEVGRALVADPRIGLITFTGGGRAATEVAVSAAARHVPTVLELGGKSASLVFADAALAQAAKVGALLGTAQNSGQGCFLPTRMLVERSVYDEVVDAVVTAVGRFRLGDPFEAGTTMGPVATAAACERILGVIETARAEGQGRLVAGGRRAGGELAAGFYVEPTVFADVDPASGLAQEEIFGPVLAISPFDTEAEGIDIANGTAFGLAGYVWTQNLDRAHRVAAALDAGYVSVNSMAALPPGAPFGGWKASGHGVEGGRPGLAEFLRIKNVHVQLGKGPA